jgi:transposase
MKRIRRQHTAEFKAHAVRLVEQTGRPATVVARELGLHPAVLQGWVRATSAAPVGRGAVDESLEAENRRLREENAQLRDERDLLKKAAAYFANASR